MKTKYLLPHSFKFPGWIILAIGIIFGILFLCFDEVFDIKIMMPALHNMSPWEPPWIHNSGWFKFINNSVLDEITATFIIVGSLFIAFSKEKIEDEYIMKIRLESIVWAVLVNSVIMLFCIFVFYGLSFMMALMFNMVSIMLLFVIKFKVSLRKSSIIKSSANTV